MTHKVLTTKSRALQIISAGLLLWALKESLGWSISLLITQQPCTRIAMCWTAFSAKLWSISLPSSASSWLHRITLAKMTEADKNTLQKAWYPFQYHNKLLIMSTNLYAHAPICVIDFPLYQIGIIWDGNSYRVYAAVSQALGLRAHHHF